MNVYSLERAIGDIRIGLQAPRSLFVVVCFTMHAAFRFPVEWINKTNITRAAQSNVEKEKRDFKGEYNHV